MKRAILILLLILGLYSWAEGANNFVSGTIDSSNLLLNAETTGDTFAVKLDNNAFDPSAPDSATIFGSSCSNATTCSAKERLTFSAVSCTGTHPSRICTITVNARNQAGTTHSGDWGAGSKFVIVPGEETVSQSGSIVVLHKDGTTTTYNPSADSDTARGTALLSAISAAVTGDSVQLAANTYDIQTNKIDLSLAGTGTVHLIGQSKYGTIIKSSYNSGSSSRTIINPGNGSEVRKLSIVGTAASSVYQMPWGANTNDYAFTNALLDDVYISASSDGIYIAKSGSTATARNITCASKWDCVTIYAGSTLSIYDSTLTSVADSQTPDNGAMAHGMLLTGTNAIVYSYNNTVTASNGTSESHAYDVENGAKLYVYDSGTITSSGSADVKDFYIQTNISPAYIYVSAGVPYDSSKVTGTITTVGTAAYATALAAEFNVKSYGAVCNGSTDDTTAIQNTINAAQTAGRGKVHVSGLCKITSKLVINTSDIAFVCDGIGTGLLKTADFSTVTDPMLQIKPPSTTPIYRNQVSDCQFVANASTTGGAALQLDGTWYFNGSNIHIEDTFGGIEMYATHSPQFNNINIWSGQYFTSSQTGSYYWKMGNSSVGFTVPQPVAVYMNNVQMRYSNASLGANGIYNGLVVNAVDGLIGDNIHINMYHGSGFLFQPVSNSSITTALLTNIYADGDTPSGSSGSTSLNVTGTTTGSLGEIKIADSQFAGQNNSKSYTGISLNSSSLQGFKMINSTVRGWQRHGVEILSGTDIGFDNVTSSNNNCVASTYDGFNISATNPSYVSLSNVKVGVPAFGTTCTQDKGIEAGSGIVGLAVNGSIFGANNTTSYSIASAPVSTDLFTSLTEKTTPADADLVQIEDSAASNIKKKVQVSNLRKGITVAGGGTGLTTLTAHAVLLGEGTANVGVADPGSSSGYCLLSNGVGNDPSFQACPGQGGSGCNAGVNQLAVGTTCSGYSGLTYQENGSDRILQLGVSASMRGVLQMFTNGLINGSDAASGTLTLSSTSNATKGKVIIGSSAVDEANNRIGIGTTTPLYRLDIRGSSVTSQLHFASADADSGGYIGSTAAGVLHMSGGSYYDSAQSSWVAKSTTASTINLGTAGLYYYFNTGLTAGNTYTQYSVFGVTASIFKFYSNTHLSTLLTGITGPSVSSCGTGTPSIVGTDTAGKVTVGTGSPTACTVSFGQTHTNTPACVVTLTSDARVYISAQSATGFTITTSSGMTAGFNYVCIGVEE